MGSDIGKCGIFGQILLVIVNIIFIGLGIAAIAVGAWAIASGSSFSFVTGSEVIGGSAILIIIGCAVIVIAAVGLFGAMCKVRPLLVIYAIVVLIIVICEIAAGIAAVVYRDRLASAFDDFGTGLIVQYDSQDQSSDITTTVNLIQTTFRCCGATNASDWVELNLDAITQSTDGRPPACLECTVGQDDNCATFFYTVSGAGGMDTRNFTTTDVGCASVDTTQLLGLAIGAGVVGIIFGLLEIAGIVIALLLCCCIHRAHQQTVV